MRTLINRLMELTIVLTFALSAFSAWNVNFMSGKTQYGNDSVPASLPHQKLLHQAIWDRYGPGSKQAYVNIFGGRQDQVRFSYGLSSEDAWFFTSRHCTRHLGETLGFAAVPDAPIWYLNELNGAEKAANRLNEVLDKGPAITAPDEGSFSYWNYVVLNYQNGGKTLRHLALRDWIDGNRDRSVERLHDIARLGEALRYSPILIEQVIKSSLIKIGLSGFETVIWNDPAPEHNKKIYDILTQINFWNGIGFMNERVFKIETWGDPDSEYNRKKIFDKLTQFNTRNWTFPPYTESILWWDFNNESLPMNPDDFGAYVILWESLNPERINDIDTLLHQKGVLPKTTRSSYQAIALFDKWTTIPAMTKRLKTLPDSFFDSDDLLSPEAAKQVPRVLYAASRYSKGPLASRVAEREKYLETAQAEALTLAGAYWIRCWHDDHGTWPTVEDFNSSPYENSLKLIITQDSSSIVEAFLKMHPTANQEFGFEKAFAYPGKNDEIIFPMNYPEDETHEDNRGSMYLGFYKDALSLKSPRPELEKWTKGMFMAMQPWVESIEVHPLIEMIKSSGIRSDLYGAYNISALKIKLNLPQKTYWVAHPGPDGEFASSYQTHYVDIDSEERRQSGDIFILAGWE